MTERRWRPGRLARNTILATCWQGLRLVLQFAYLILVARLLGVEGYGIFSGSVALATSISPLVGWGFGIILVQEVSRSPQNFPEFWAKALRAVSISGPVLVGVILVLAPLLLPVNSHGNVILLIAAAELLVMPLIATSSQAFHAHERLGWTMFNHIQLNLARFLAILLLAAIDQRGLASFAWAYLGATALAALLSLYQINRAFGAPAWTRSSLNGHLRSGLGFSLSLVANSAHGEIDKTLLLRLGDSATAGNYSLATRIVSAATTPLVAYILSATPRLFREGKQGTAVLAWRLLPPIIFYGIVAAAGLFICSPFLLWIFGAEYSEAVNLVRWLAPLPLFIGISQLGLNALSATGRQHTRLLFEAIGLTINVLLNIILIPIWQALGSAIAILASQFLLALMATTTLSLSTGDNQNRPINHE